MTQASATIHKHGGLSAFFGAIKSGDASLIEFFLDAPEASVLSGRCIRAHQHNDGDDSSASMYVFRDHAYCYGCGSYWWPDQFIRDAANLDLDLSQARHVARRRASVPLPQSQVETFHQYLFGPYSDRLEWLHARGLRDDTLRANKVGHKGDAFVIPVRSEIGVDWASLRFRRDDAVSQGGPKYYGLTGLNTAAFYAPIPPELPYSPAPAQGVFLCEGELDALRLAQERFPAVSLTNGCNAFRAEHVELLEGTKTVYVLYDQDIPGRAAALKLTQLPGLSGRTHVVKWPPALGKDVTEFLQRWPLQQLVNYVNQARGS